MLFWKLLTVHPLGVFAALLKDTKIKTSDLKFYQNFCRMCSDDYNYLLRGSGQTYVLGYVVLISVNRFIRLESY